MRSKTLNLGVPPTTFPFAELVKQEKRHRHAHRCNGCPLDLGTRL